MQQLIENGATVVVIEHDLDMMANADYLIDMGPGGGEQGGTIVCEGTPVQVAACTDSITGAYLAPLVCDGSTAPGAGAPRPAAADAQTAAASPCPAMAPEPAK